MIIAVDFDGTLCEEMFPGIGAAKDEIVEALKRRKAAGDRLILWTCRCGEQLAEAVEWCEARGLIFDAVNSNLPDMVYRYGNDCRKIFADEYWEDKAVTPDEIRRRSGSDTISRDIARALYAEAMQRGIEIGAKKMVDVYSDALEAAVAEHYGEKQANSIMLESVQAAVKAFDTMMNKIIEKRRDAV